MRDSVDAAHVQGVQLDNDLRRHPCDQNLEPLDTSVSTVLICRSGSTHPNFQVGGGQAFRTLCPSAKRRPDTEVSIKRTALCHNSHFQGTDLFCRGFMCFFLIGSAPILPRYTANVSSTSFWASMPISASSNLSRMGDALTFVILAGSPEPMGDVPASVGVGGGGQEFELKNLSNTSI